MPEAKLPSSLKIADDAVVHFLASVLDHTLFTFQNLAVTEKGLSGYAVDPSNTLYCEFEVPRRSVKELSPSPTGTITIATEELEGLLSSAASHFPPEQSSLTLRLSSNGIKVEYEVAKLLLRKKRVADVPAERQRRLSFAKLAEAAEAVPSDPRFLTLVSSTFGKVENVPVTIDKDGLRLGPSEEDRLTLNVESRGRASTVVPVRIFRVVSKYVQVKDVPRVAIKVVDGGILAFEFTYEQGPSARYVVTRAVEAG